MLLWDVVFQVMGDSSAVVGWAWCSTRYQDGWVGVCALEVCGMQAVTLFLYYACEMVLVLFCLPSIWGRGRWCVEVLLNV